MLMLLLLLLLMMMMILIKRSLQMSNEHRNVTFLLQRLLVLMQPVSVVAMQSALAPHIH